MPFLAGCIKVGAWNAISFFFFARGHLWPGKGIALVFPKDQDLFPQIQMTLIYEVAKSHMDLVGRPTDLHKS